VVLSALYSFQLVLLFSFQQGMVDLKVGSYLGIGRELSERTELLRILGLVIYPLCPLLTMSRDQLCNHHGEKEAESGGGGAFIWEESSMKCAMNTPNQIIS
jgi:hypothetical protein